MIVAEFLRKSDNFIGFKVSGHAGYANNGKDIVCASVSSAVQLTANLITENFGINAKVSVLKDTIKLTITSDCDNNANKLIDGFMTHLKIISQEFQNHIKISITEV